MMIWSDWQEELITALEELETSFQEVEMGLTTLEQGLQQVETGLTKSEEASSEAERRLDELDNSWDAYQTAVNTKVELLQKRATLLTYGLIAAIILGFIGTIL